MDDNQGIPTWRQRLPKPLKTWRCTMNCSPRGHYPCEDCESYTVEGDAVKARDEEIAALRAALRGLTKQGKG